MKAFAYLTGTLATNGLGDSPGTLFLPQLNYCRIGEDGPIEAEPNPTEPEAPASLGWISLGDEFDIPGAAADVYDEVVRTLNARRATMATIPPIDTGVTIVQFPMWLWLEDFDPLVEVTALSEPNNSHRVQGRATFDHAIWHLGSTDLRCEPEDMRAYDDSIDLRSVADRPACHHIFTELEQYQAEVTVVYRLEQQISTRRSPDHSYVATAWQPHPNGEFIPVTTTGPQVEIREIYALNVATE